MIDKKRSVKCPDHKDKHASAVVYIRDDGTEWLHCKACHANRILKEGNKEIKMFAKGVIVEDDDYDVEVVGIDFKQCLNEVELLEHFEEQKGIPTGAIKNLNGYVTDKGYLAIPYGKRGKTVYRCLLPDKKPRFINDSSNPGLLGEEIIRLYDELFLVGGVTDWLSFKHFIKPNVVGSFGEELSDEQAYLLSSKTIFIIYDLDFGGHSGTLQAQAQLLKYGAVPIPLTLYDNFVNNSEKIDVNFLCKNDVDNFRKWIDTKTRKYQQFDESYYEDFKNAADLKYYKSDIPDFKLAEGLYVITGEPGVGKTTTGISLVENFIDQGGSVLYANYDLPKDQILARLASRHSKKYGWAEIEADRKLVSKEEGLENWFKQCLKNVKVMQSLTLSEIKYCKKYYTHIIIDYLQRVPKPHSDQRVGLEMIMDELANMAADEGMIVVGISRMPAAQFGKGEGHLFSGTAAIEYHAQGAIVLKRAQDNIISFDMRKNTRGATFVTPIKMDYPHQRFIPTNLKEIESRYLGDRLWKEEE